MRLASLKIDNPGTVSEARDGQLVVVSGDSTRAAPAPSDFPTLLSAIESWDRAEPALREVARSLGESGGGIVLSERAFMAPFPRTWQWLDGSAFIQHIILVRKARGAEPPEDLFTIPLMYQGISDTLLGPDAPLLLQDEGWGMDFEGELCVVVDDVPQGTRASTAMKHIRLLLLMNDVSLRNLIPRELATGFGFFHGKPSSSFAPFAVTPDEIGDAWKDGRVHLELETRLNGQIFGHPNAGEMHFSFCDLIEHAARTRSLSAGTIIGSGTVSNREESVGSSCIVERRMLEKINTGEMRTPFLKHGDLVEMDVRKDNRSIFGRISQRVTRAV